MSTKPAVKGPWITRFAIRFFTLVLAVLIYWLLGFFIKDIESIQGPQYDVIEKKHVEQALKDKQNTLNQDIAEITRRINNEKDTQKLIGDSSRSLQQTIGQLLDLQKLGLEKNMAFSDTQQDNFTSSLNLFLENQKKYQELNKTLTDLLHQKQTLEDEKKRVERQIEKQRKPAREEYEQLWEKHRLKLAFYQLLILVPLLVVAGFLIIKKRTSLYWPLFLAFGGAALLKVTLVIHKYFPTRYFKYILIVALLIVVARILVHLIRAIAYPKMSKLIKQYREAYERFLCPVCEYPIRIGPRRFLFWTRRTVNKMVFTKEHDQQDKPYSCPSCGTSLFEECASCGKIRHALLPHCEHCGVEKTLE